MSEMPVVVEVGDHDARQHIIVVVDGEVDRLGVAKGAGGGVTGVTGVTVSGRRLGAAGARRGGSGVLVAAGAKMLPAQDGCGCSVKPDPERRKPDEEVGLTGWRG